MCLCTLRYDCGGECVGTMATNRVVRVGSVFHFQLMVVCPEYLLQLERDAGQKFNHLKNGVSFN